MDDGRPGTRQQALGPAARKAPGAGSLREHPAVEDDLVIADGRRQERPVDAAGDDAGDLAVGVQQEGLVTGHVGEGWSA
jgi:hypothetical protein